MKYLSRYKTFEKIHPINTNILELNPKFVSDIKHICLDLVDELNLEKDDLDGLVTFYSTHFRSSSFIKRPYPDHPSISIHLPFFAYGYIFGERDSNYNPAKDCQQLKEVAIRIKDYLGEAFIAFVASIGSSHLTYKLNINTNLYSGIGGFEIVYDPKLI